jgi:prepilin-type N-terminal cleavage/methylation domain-containing protein
MYNVVGMFKNRIGFTLIELLITIALVGLMSAAVVSVIGPQPQRYGRDTRRRGDMQSIASAIEMYRNDHSGYPVAAGWEGLLTGGGYMSSIPTDPKTPATHYTYTPAICNIVVNGVTYCRTFSLCSSSMESAGVANPTCVTNP